MKRLLRYILLLSLLTLSAGIVSAQQSNIRGEHLVKKKETIFGISRMYGLTIEELVKANPEMNAPDYELKKGAVLRIPYSKADIEAAEAEKIEKPPPGCIIILSVRCPQTCEGVYKMCLRTVCQEMKGG